MNPLNSVPAAIVSGGGLAIIAFVVIPGTGFNELSLARWLHILSGISTIARTIAISSALIVCPSPG
jgi:hypothetical protein